MGTLVQPYRFGVSVDPHIGVPTRGYFASGGTSAVTPSFNAAWDVTTSAAQRPLLVASELSTGTNGNDTSLTETSTSIVNRLKRQHVSNQQIPSGRTIPAGTALSFIIGATESGATSDSYLQIVTYIVDSTGATVRGTLYGGQVSNTVVATVGANNEEISTSLLTRIVQVVTPADVVAQANDRWVVEIGYRATNTLATSLGVLFRVNDQTSATGDLALTSGTNVSTGSVRPWVELNYDLFGA